MLFKTTNIEPIFDNNSICESHSFSLKDTRFIDAREKRISECFLKLEAESFTSFVSNGAWSMHELVLYVLSLSGPAHVYFCTWSMTEDPCRRLIGAMNDGQILSLTGLLDVRVSVRNKAVLEFAKMNMTTVRQAICHAKVSVIENENWQISIVGSANMTKNPRIEAGNVIVSREVAAFNKKWILDEIEKAGCIE